MHQQSGKLLRAPLRGGLDLLQLQLLVLLSVSGVLSVSIGELTAELQNSLEDGVVPPPRSHDAAHEAQAEPTVASDPDNELWRPDSMKIHVLQATNSKTPGLSVQAEVFGDSQPPDTETISESEAQNEPLVNDYNGQLPAVHHTVVVSNISSQSSEALPGHKEIMTFKRPENDSWTLETMAERRFRRQAYSSGCANFILRGDGGFTSSSYPLDYGSNLYCTWRLEAAVGCRAIFLQVLRFSTEQCCDHVLIQDGTGARRILSGVMQSHFYTLQAPVLLTFRTDSSVVSTGFEMAFSSVQCSSGYACGAYTMKGAGIIRSPAFPEQYQNNIACLWRLETAMGNGSVFLRFLHFSTQWERDKVRFFSKSGYESTNFGVARGWIRLPAPAAITFTTDSSVTSSGFEIAFRSLPPSVAFPENECHYSLATSGFITSSNFPDNYADNTVCSLELKVAPGYDAMALMISQFSTEKCCDYLRVSSDNGIVTTFSGAVGPRVEIFALPVYISFTTDSSVTSTGFKLQYVSLQQNSISSGFECRGTKTGSGILRSPGYPAKYPNNVICSWRLEAPANDGVIFVRIVNFSTEECCDRLRISNSTHLQALIAGSVQPQLFKVSSPAFISFTADDSASLNGFEITFSSVARDAYNAVTAYECGGSLNGSGVIRSPGYPGNYFNNMSCLWRLEAASGSSNIFLQILDFSTQQCCDHLSISNGTAIETIISGEAQQRLYTFGSPLFITFTTDSFGASRGFEIAFSSAQLPSQDTDLNAECGSTIYGPSLVTAPHFGEPHPSEINCSWSLQSRRAENSSIQLTLNGLSMRECCDYLEISDGSGFQYTFSGSIGVHEAISLQLQSPAKMSFISNNASNRLDSEFRILVGEVQGISNGICHADSWVVQGTSCFKAMLSAVGVSWYEARSQCRLLGGFLVEIESSDEQKFVEDYLRTYVPFSEEVWIGLKRGASEDDPWRWDSGRPLTYTNWTAGQPSSMSGESACGALNFGSWLGWSTFDCGLRKIPLCMLRRSSD